MAKVQLNIPDEMLETVDEYLDFVKIWTSRNEFLKDAIRYRLENASSFVQFCKEREE